MNVDVEKFQECLAGLSHLYCTYVSESYRTESVFKGGVCGLSFEFLNVCIVCVRGTVCLCTVVCMTGDNLQEPALFFSLSMDSEEQILACHPCVSSAFYWLRHPVNHWFLRQGFTRQQGQ